MPGDNLVCSKARLRMCLRTPGVREAAIRQKKDADDAAARLEQVGEVSLGEQYGVASRHGAVRLSLSLRQIGTSQPARPASQSAPPPWLLLTSTALWSVGPRVHCGAHAVRFVNWWCLIAPAGAAVCVPVCS